MGMIMQLRRAAAAEIDGLAGNPSAAYEFLTAPEASLSLDKSWHAIHFLLTGAADGLEMPGAFLLAGEPVGEDMGYGPMLTLNPELVTHIDRYLAILPDDYITSGFDFDALAAAEVYPAIWDRHDPADLEYVIGHFQRLQQFVADAAAQRQGLVVAIT